MNAPVEPHLLNPLAPPPGSPMARRGFTWGVATASYQIEGAADEDGRLRSIWDTYCDQPGNVLNGDSGAQACDHYHRWSEDVDLIADLGVDAYRLSIAWPRVMHADGAPNPKGLDFYKRLLDRLADRGIQRMVTLYHWDLPQHLEDRGGWLNRDTAYRFADFAELMARELGGRVNAWATLNEPWCSAYLGYCVGRHAPGLKNLRYATQAMHHLLLGHGLAVQRLAQLDPATPRGLVANVGRGSVLDGAGPADAEAARLFEMQHNDWVLQPLLKGSYPDELFTRLWPGAAPLVLPGDLATISQPLDFLGINFYFRSTVRHDAEHGYAEVERPGVERTQMGWEVHPGSLEHLLRDFHARYPNLPPVYITENGMASNDEVVDGRVHDEQRQRYLRRHFEAVSRAIEAGVDVRGYYVWSLMDNFEWAYGYERRFGLVHVDYQTQQRTLKDSALMFRQFLQARAR